MAAAALSKTGKLGSVSAFAIPELITSINAFTLGAQAVKPDIEVSVVWVNSWFDPAKEQEAAKALIAQKCDVIFSNAQDTPSVISACEEAGVYAFNLNSSMKKYAPKTYLGCVATDWSPFFKASVDAHLAGTFKGANAFLGVADKVVEVVDWNPDIPADVMQEMGSEIVKAANLVAEAIPLLDRLGANAQRLAAIAEEVTRVEGRSDELHDQGLKDLFLRHGASGNAMAYMIGSQLYGELEKVVDRFEDVANEISGILIENV